MNKLKCIKTSLNSIVSNKLIKYKINDVVYRCNDIIIHTYQFLKTYLIYKFETKYKMPTIDQNLILNIIKTITTNKNNRGRKSTKNNQLLDELKYIYNHHFSNLNANKINYSNLSHIMRYLSVDIITNIENNIKFHFVDHVKNFTKYMYNKLDYKLTKYELNKITNKIFNNKKININNDPYKNGDNVHNLLMVEYINKLYFPQIDEKNRFEDLHKHPQKYLISMLRMNREIENYNNSLSEDNHNLKQKLYSILPLRKSITPKYIPIDTTIILDVLIENNISHFYSSIKQNKDNIWRSVFKQLFKKKNKKLLISKNYKFNNLLYTDGYAVSLIQVKKEYYGKKIRGRKLKNEFKYIDDLKNKDLNELKDYKLVGVDPGKRNILNLADENRNKLRYTCMQRRFECGFKKARNKIKNLKTDRIIEKETEISKYSSKSCILKDFKEYIKIKNKINNKLKRFYRNEIFRKLKWKVYMDSQQSESNLVNNIKSKFGSNICLAYGNWSQKKQMRNYVSTPGIGIKRKLANYFKIITVDEYKTSQTCYNCENKLENFQLRENPRPYKEGNHFVHSLLRCKNVNCNKFWDRDVNASLNMVKIIKQYISNKTRPKPLLRNQKG